MNEGWMLTPSSTPNQIRAMASLSGAGPSSGTTKKGRAEKAGEKGGEEEEGVGKKRKARAKKSRKKARMKQKALVKMRKPSWPPGRLVRRCSTQRSPSTPRKTRLKTVEPMRMKTTKEESFAVVSIAWRKRLQSRRLLMRARMSAPVAPIAPPSVGVATPMKIVPSTRKISASGGVSTQTTRSAIRLSS